MQSHFQFSESNRPHRERIHAVVIERVEFGRESHRENRSFIGSSVQVGESQRLWKPHQFFQGNHALGPTPGAQNARTQSKPYSSNFVSPAL